MNELYEQKMTPAKYVDTGSYACMHYDGITIPEKLTKENVTVCVASKNRLQDFKNLSNTIKLQNKKLVTQGERYDVPGWVEKNITDDDILPAYAHLAPMFPHIDKTTCTAKHSFTWAKNEVFTMAETEWIATFDDDFVLGEDWLDYYIDVQNFTSSPIVMNNFGAFVFHYPTFRKYLMSIDERYINGTTGHEDEDFFARWIESGLKMVVGFNRNHKFEDDSWRGSSTGYNSFVHKRSMSGGCRSSNVMNFNNRDWHLTKWSFVNENTGVQTRPPFKGWVRRNIKEEIDWIGDYH